MARRVDRPRTGREDSLDRVPGRSKTHRPDTFSSVVTVDRRPSFRGNAGTLCRRDGVFVAREGK